MRKATLLTLMAAISAHANAADLFDVSASIINGTTTQSVSEAFENVQSVINFVHNNNLSTVASSYTPNSGVNANILYLGVPVNLSYAQNSTTLTFSIPGLGVSQTFTGATRDQSASDFEAFLKGNGGSLVNQFQKYLAQTSYISPLAGNPGSLQSGMAAASFAASSNTGANVTANSESGGRFGIDVSAGEFSVKGISGTSVEVPLSYSYRFANPGWQIKLNMPLGFQEIGSAQSYSAQIGLGLQIPLIHGVDWYLIPNVSAGATGSEDLGAAGVMYSGTLSSRYTYHVSPDFAVTLSDMAGQVDSAKINVAGYNIDPAINNTLIKNGLEAEYTTSGTFWGEPLSLRGGVAQTDALGAKLAIQDYTEFFVDFGVLTTVDAPFYKRLRLGATYTTGASYQAGSINFGYIF